MGQKVYVYQDGANFYRDEEPTEGQSSLMWSAPYAVGDHDMPAAERARADFIEYAKFVLTVDVVF